MILHNPRLVSQKDPVTICINNETISNVSKNDIDLPASSVQLHFNDAIAFPGLINSHDHLDFNCFSPLRKGYYKNYTAWGNDIHERYKGEIEAVLKIPPALRATWGMYKNLLAGVTTVVNHGDVLKMDDPLVTILQQEQSLHSVKFEKNWKRKLNDPFKRNKLCVIHVGEGVDNAAHDEIDELIKWNFLKRKLVGIHAVAMSTYQAKKFRAIIWCPESNKFLLDKTADIKGLKNHTEILFGTDSTLTGNWNIWQHLRLARSMQQVSDEKLYNMITKDAAALWGLNSGEINKGMQADIVIADTKAGNYSWEAFYAINPQDILMVIQKGRIRLFDSFLLPKLKDASLQTEKYKPVKINNATKYVEGDLPGLMNTIRDYYPGADFPCILDSKSGSHAYNP